MTVYLGLADYLLIAEAVLGVPAELIADFNRIGLADSALAAPRAGFGGVEAYPEFATKALPGGGDRPPRVGDLPGAARVEQAPALDRAGLLLGAGGHATRASSFGFMGVEGRRELARHVPADRPSGLVEDRKCQPAWLRASEHPEEPLGDDVLVLGYTAPLSVASQRPGKSESWTSANGSTCSAPRSCSQEASANERSFGVAM